MLWRTTFSEAYVLFIAYTIVQRGQYFIECSLLVQENKINSILYTKYSQNTRLAKNDFLATWLIW